MAALCPPSTSTTPSSPDAEQRLYWREAKRRSRLGLSMSRSQSAANALRYRVLRPYCTGPFLRSEGGQFRAGRDTDDTMNKEISR
jgi:hypothetical protein